MILRVTKMAGVKGRSGPKPHIKPKSDSGAAYRYIEDNIMEITRIAVEAALKGDVSVALQLHNRLWGLPKTKIESESTIKYSADQLQGILDKAMIQLSEQQQQFIHTHYGGSNALQIEASTKGSSQEGSTEA